MDGVKVRGLATMDVCHIARHPGRSLLRPAVFALAALLVTKSALGGNARPVLDTGRSDLAAQVQALTTGEALQLTDLYLDGLGPVALELERFRVFAEDARMLRGNRVNPLPNNVYLRGGVEGFPDSLVVLSFRERGTIGGLLVVNGEYWEVSGRAGVGGLLAQRSEAEVEGAPFECLTDDLQEEPDRTAAMSDAGSVDADLMAASPSGGFNYTARVAVETDWEFLNRFGGDQAAATDYVGDLFAFASSIYEAEVDTSLQVSFLRLWPGSSGSDPWSANDCGNQLYEFRDHWRAEEGGRTRAIAHMLSGKSTGCGIAYVGALCTNSYGYGVSGSLGGNFDPTQPLPPVWDILVVSHEIGHNFNSPHTHCYNGIPDASYADPIDPCYTASGCYSGTKSLPAGCPGSRQACGTIMSYCHLLSGGRENIAMTFGGSVLDGSSHLYGVFPERVPERMHAYVLSRAGSGCLDPAIANYTLSITKAGAGTGTVTTDDGLIDCGSDCSQAYADGSVVALVAEADIDSTFSGWSGDPDCTDAEVTMTNGLACTATFDLEPPPTFALSVARAGTGAGIVTSTPGGIDCGIDCLESFNQGTVVTLSAAPNVGSVFVGWSGEADCSDGSVTMDAATNCVATFNVVPPPDHTLEITRGGAGGGTVTSSPTGIDCGTDCSHDFVKGTIVVLTASADSQSFFFGWGGDPDCADGTVQLSAERLCEARFKPVGGLIFRGDFEIGDTSRWEREPGN